MTLVELLHAHYDGHWPESAALMVQDMDGQVWPSEPGEAHYEGGYWSTEYVHDHDFYLTDVADDYATSVVRKDDFEAFGAKQDAA